MNAILVSDQRYTDGHLIPFWNTDDAGLGPIVITDPDWANVSLLMHMDGSNGGTTFTDEKGHVCTPSGGAVTSNAQLKFGTSSALVNSVSDYISVANSSDFDFGGGDFTIEFWAYRTRSFTDQPIISRDGSPSGDRGAWLFDFDGTYLQFYATSSVGTWNIFSGGQNCPLASNAWVHVALTRSGNTWRMFSDGTQCWSNTSSASLMSGTVDMSIGAWPKYSTYFGGYIDDVRLTKGVARYNTISFVPPTAAFPNS